MPLDFNSPICEVIEAYERGAGEQVDQKLRSDVRWLTLKLVRTFYFLRASVEAEIEINFLTRWSFNGVQDQQPETVISDDDSRAVGEIVLTLAQFSAAQCFTQLVCCCQARAVLKTTMHCVPLSKYLQVRRRFVEHSSAWPLFRWISRLYSDSIKKAGRENRVAHHSGEHASSALWEKKTRWDLITQCFPFFFGNRLLHDLWWFTSHVFPS